jgi:uncharacterized iron-regulated membrane protein
MTIKKLIEKIHLVLGLGSGVVVFVISITGCIYAFQEEIQDMMQSYRFVVREDKAVLPPSSLIQTAQAALPGKHIHAVMYSDGRSAQVIFFNFSPEYYYYVIYLNPYSGKILKVENMSRNFFRIILDGHFYLWLPPNIGQPIAATATLIFVVLLITGLVLWWPKNRKSAKQRFVIKWDGRWRRTNYDLHRVFGFYVLSIALLLAVTGLVWGFEWFAKSYHTVAGGEKSLLYVEPVSEKATQSKSDKPAVDVVFAKMVSMYPNVYSIEVHTPETDSSSIAANANAKPGTYYATDYRYFDQHSFKELEVDHIYGRYENADAADKLIKMNYDIHVGAILGLPGKILAFFASLICASLPVTGTLLWWGRRNKAKKDTKLTRNVPNAPKRRKNHEPAISNQR